jgi:pimeloyl-ACP methyl ester carboxylesterase
MVRIFRAARPGLPAPTRVIWLPGAYHAPEDFLSAGFDAEVRRRGLDLDLEFVPLRLDHVADRSTVEQLRHDVIEPARAQGCRTIWLAGISLGGLFAMDYAAGRDADWDGLCLLAPYLGNRLLIAEIVAAGGIDAWKPGPLAESDEERRIWRFVQGLRTEPRPLYLGYGAQDRFAQAHGIMASALPPQTVRVAPGGHDWPTWAALWTQFLELRFS